MSKYTWLKLDTEGILRGTLSNADNIVQLVWIKLLCLHSETHARDGWLHHSPGNPYSHEYIAVNCFVTVPILEKCLEVYRGDGRITEGPDGDIFIVNWERYQTAPKGAPKRKRSKMTHLEKLGLDLSNTARLFDEHPELVTLFSDPARRKEAIDKIIEINKAAENGGK